MFQFLIEALLGVGVEYLLKDVETPPDPSKITINETDPELVLYAAAMIDHAGEWDRAISLYELALRNWPAEHGQYAQNCIAAIQGKIAYTRNGS